MADRLKGKLALVTAAGQGMGRACALQMAAEGATVWATDLNAQLLQAFDGVPGIRTRTLDVLDDAAVKAVIDELPVLDVLFNCAGYVHHGSIVDCSPDDWAFSMNLNVRSMYSTIRAAVPRMLDRFAATGQGASIINMASVAGASRGLANRFVYGTSKAAVVGLTKAVAADYVKRGIRCNVVAPGTVDTPSLAGRINAFADPVAARQMFVDRQPMGRLAQADEIAPIVVYLASDESVFATGQVFTVDGGMMI